MNKIDTSKKCMTESYVCSKLQRTLLRAAFSYWLDAEHRDAVIVAAAAGCQLND